MKDTLRLIALDAGRKVDMEQAIRSIEVVQGARGFMLLVQLHDHVNLTEAQLINRQQAFERRAGLVTHSRGVVLLGTYWGMPLSLLQGAHSDAPATQFAVSQMGDFSPSQYAGAQSAFYPDASLVQWDANDLPPAGGVRKEQEHKTDS